VLTLLLLLLLLLLLCKHTLLCFNRWRRLQATQQHLTS
jgi:hypothetical protein